LQGIDRCCNVVDAKNPRATLVGDDVGGDRAGESLVNLAARELSK
jgi:hypothetical protein